MWETKWLWSKWLWGHSCGFVIVDVCFANIQDLSLCCFDFLCHLDFFTEESESQEDVTADSPRGSSDDWSEETSETSWHCHFCPGSMNQGCARFCFFDDSLDLSKVWLLLPDPFAGMSSSWFKKALATSNLLAGAMTGPGDWCSGVCLLLAGTLARGRLCSGLLFQHV